jgi:hypothetical protein
MKRLLSKLVPLAACAGALLLLSGCASSLQRVTQPNAQGVPTESFQIAPSVTNALATVGALTSALAPANPYAGITDLAVKGFGAIALGVLGMVARSKTKKLQTANAVNQAIIRGVETADAPAANAVKESVKEQAALAGVTADVHAAVKSNTL